MTRSSNLIITGSFLRLFTLVINIAIAFFLMPFIIHNIGDRWYGLWVIVGSVMGYYGLLDFGLSTATQRYVAKSLAEGDDVGVNTAITTSLITFCGLSLVSIIITAIVIIFGDVFFEKKQDIEIFQMVIAIMGVKVAVCFPFYAFNGIISAKLRFDIANYVQLGKLLLRSILFLYYIKNGYSIISLAAITVLVEISGYLVIAQAAYKLYPKINISFLFYQYKKLKEFVNYGKYVFITSIADIVRFTIDELVIAAYISLSFVTHYIVAARLIGYAGQAMGALFGVLLPVFTKDYGKKDWDSLRTKYFITSKMSLLITFLIGGLLIVLGDEFIALWMGKHFLDAYLPLVILAVGFLFASSQRPSVSILYAIGKHKYYAYMTIIEAVFNLIISIILIQYIGFVGVALGTAIPLIISKVYFQPKYTCKQLNISFSEYFRQLLPIILYALVMLRLLLFLTNKISVEGFSNLLITSVSFSLIYILFYLRFFIDKNTSTFLINSLPQIVVKLHLIRNK